MVKPCPDCGDADDSNRWGHTEPGTYDGTLYWSCAACGHVWSRDFGDSRLTEISRRRVWEIHATRHA